MKCGILSSRFSFLALSPLLTSYRSLPLHLIYLDYLRYLPLPLLLLNFYSHYIIFTVLVGERDSIRGDYALRSAASQLKEFADSLTDYEMDFS